MTTTDRQAAAVLEALTILRDVKADVVLSFTGTNDERLASALAGLDRLAEAIYRIEHRAGSITPQSLFE